MGKVGKDLKEILVVGNFSDNPTAMDISHCFGQANDISDVISLKTFENTEFCPRFISSLPDELQDPGHIGRGLEGKGVVIVSASSVYFSRNDIAMRNMLVARAAKDNGASWVFTFGA